MLREIAEADYGMDAAKHLNALKRIVGGDRPAPLEWEPKEVLELMRWSQPEDPTWAPGSTGERGHWIRLFACSVLLRLGGEPENVDYMTGEESTLIQLVDSAIVLGPKTVETALQLIAWRMRDCELYDEDRPFFATAIMLLLAVSERDDPRLATWLIQQAQSDQEDRAWNFKNCVKTDAWKRLIESHLVNYAGTVTKLKAFGRELLDELDG
ncbi:MAG: hypothetical protein AAGH92_08150 [Planctomycetota bacterium]